MSDYLDHLMAKALSPMEGIQPRLASLFEPPSATARPMAAHQSAEGEPTPDEPFPGAPSLEAPVSTRESFGQAGESRPPPTGPGRPAATRSQQPTGITDTPTDHPPGHRVNRQPATLRIPQSVDTVSGQLPTQFGPNPDRTTSTAIPAASSSIRAAGQETAAGPSTPTAKQESLSALEHIIDRAAGGRGVLFDVPPSAGSTPPESLLDHAGRSSTPAMTVVRPLLTLSREPPASVPSEGTAMPGSPPTIRVTIGRVDVRAVMPAALAPRPATARPIPALSLEDYLEQHGGRKR